MNTTRPSIYPMKKEVSFNWPVVGFLLFMTAIPAVPAIFILLLVGLGPDAVSGASEFINAEYYLKPLAISVHAGAGILFFVTMPFQFSPRLRQKNWHKTAGYLAVMSGCVMALSGIWMHRVLFPEQLDMRFASLVIMALGICVSFAFAVFHAVKRNIKLHRIWMCRAVAIVLAAITPMFVDGIIVLLFGHLENVLQVMINVQHDFGRLIGIALNLGVLQLFLHRAETQRNAQCNGQRQLVTEN